MNNKNFLLFNKKYLLKIMEIIENLEKINNYNIKKKINKNKLGINLLVNKNFSNPYTNKLEKKNFKLQLININKLIQLGFNLQVFEQQILLLIKMSKNFFSNKYIETYFESFIYNFNNNDYIAIISDYFEGITLDDEIKRQKNNENFDLSNLMQMMVEMSQSLDFLHMNGIADQFLNLNNIKFDNNLKRWKIINLIYSCSVEINDQYTQKVGDPYYMSPELLEFNGKMSDKEFSFRTGNDIWGLGVIYFQMANIGKNFINFSNMNPATIQNEIILKNINQSKYPYVPINSIIKVLLNKNYVERPTSGQLVILLKMARPLCIVNEKPYDRTMTKSILQSLGIEIQNNCPDNSLCQMLKDNISYCKIKNNNYDKKTLKRLSKMLGISFDSKDKSELLCKKIQNELFSNNFYYSKHITETLIHTLINLTLLEIRIRGEKKLNINNTKLNQIYNELKHQFEEVFKEAKN